MIKIPGTDEGAAGDRGGDLRGHQHQRHAAVLGRGVRARRRGATSAGSSAGSRRASRSTSTPSRASSSRASTPRSTSGSRRRATRDLQGTAARGQRARRLRALQGDLPGRAVREAARRGRPVQRPLWASTGVKNPHYPDTMYVDELVAPDTVNTMPMPTLLAAAERPRSRGATADQDPSDELAALEAAGIDMDDVTEKLLRDGIDAFVKSIDKLHRRRRAGARGDRHRPPADDRELDPRRPRAGASPRRRATPSRRTSPSASGARTRRSGARPARRRSPTGSAG